MIATSRFVHIHLHKSGGTFVNECLLRFLPDARQLGYHLPRSLLAPELATLPVLGFVRNPWSYYVSWYAFQSQRPQPNALFRGMSRDGTLDFNATVRNLLQLGSSALLDTVLAQLPATYVNHGLNLPAFALAPIRDSGLGFYDYLYRYMYAGTGENLTIGRMENLRTDLLAFLQRLELPVTPALHAFVTHGAARNASAHGDFRDYYDARTAALVGELERPLIERHGYRFAA